MAQRSTFRLSEMRTRQFPPRRSTPPFRRMTWARFGSSLWLHLVNSLIISILAALIFSKYFYLASISSCYTFYLIDRFHLSIQRLQMLLFLFLFAGRRSGRG